MMIQNNYVMEIEIEMTTELTDVSEILQKVTLVVNSAKDQGFIIKELEIESDDDGEAND
jgi:hypothetical protein